MKITPEERINDFTARGWWGHSTLLHLLDRAATQRAGHLALVDPSNRSFFTSGSALRLSFSDLISAVEALSVRLFSAGLRRDDIVVVQMPNIVELPILYLAAARLGVIVSPVPVQYGTFELSKVAAALRARAFVTTSQWKGRNLAGEHAAAFGDQCLILAFGTATPERATQLTLSAVDASSRSAWLDYLSSNVPDANDVVTICWTSGTTGEPKGVPRTHNQWMAHGLGASSVASVGRDDVMLCPFPFTNMASIGGFLVPWLTHAATLVLHHPMDVPVYLQQIEDERVTYSVAPPALLMSGAKTGGLLAGRDLSSLRVIGSGGAPLSEWIIRTYEETLGVTILNMYGSNEGISLSASAEDLPDAVQRAAYFPRYGVSGFKWRNPVAEMLRTRLVDLATGEEITEPGRPGELLIWGATVFDGYWRAPQTNSEVFTSDGFFRTGDVFEIAGKGELSRLYKFVGRCKDIIIRGGMKISPDEIDCELAAHPKVAEAAVAGYDDDVLCQRIGAVVVAKAGQMVTLSDLGDFLLARGLAKFKLPERLRVVAEMPRNASGKVVRYRLKELLHNAP